MNKEMRDLPRPQGLYDPSYEHDACGIGIVANIKGKKSYGIIDDALTILENLRHRGAEGADANSGDGAGILVQIPHQFFKRECEVLGFSLPDEGEYGVGMIFAHRYETFRHKQMEAFEDIVRSEGLSILGWRDVPVDESLIGNIAKQTCPHFLQVFIRKDPTMKTQMDFERKLYIIRKLAEKAIVPESQKNGTDFYIASLSSKTIVYKGMLTSMQLRHFFLDLSDLDFVTSMALIHSRFSTNTFPSWARAHPNRYIVHNGEINTIQGNINWLNAREGKSKSAFFPDLEKVFPVVDDTGSDSSMFDNCLEYLYMTGHSLPHAMMMMIPEPWERDPLMSEEKRAFYKYHNFMLEPWDGPAAIGFCARPATTSPATTGSSSAPKSASCASRRKTSSTKAASNRARCSSSTRRSSASSTTTKSSTKSPRNTRTTNGIKNTSSTSTTSCPARTSPTAMPSSLTI